MDEFFGMIVFGSDVLVEGSSLSNIYDLESSTYTPQRYAVLETILREEQFIGISTVIGVDRIRTNHFAIELRMYIKSSVHDHAIDIREQHIQNLSRILGRQDERGDTCRVQWLVCIRSREERRL